VHTRAPSSDELPGARTFQLANTVSPGAQPRKRLIDADTGELRDIVAEVIAEFLGAEPAKTEQSPWLTKAETAGYLSVSLVQIDIMARRESDPIPYHRVGEHRRYHRDEIDAWIRRSGVSK